MPKYNEISMGAIFQNQVEKYGDKACVAYKKDNKYTDISWNDMDKMIRNLGFYLLSLGIKKGDKIAIFSPNRFEWWVADQAILSIGAVNVPIYATNSAEESLYILKHSESKICFVATEDHLKRVTKNKKNMAGLKKIVIFDALNKKKAGIEEFGNVLKKGDAYKNKSMFDRKLKAINPGDLATIIYTSGTTGDPKGVMLSHSNFTSNVKQVYADFKNMLTDDHVLLSFLPLSHSFERTAGYYLPVLAGSKVAFAEDFSTMQENLLEIRPTFLVSVPRLYEKIHAGILAKVGEASQVKRALFKWAMKIAAKNLMYTCEDKPRKGLFAKKYNLADKLIFSKLKKAIGLDRLKVATSGAAPLSTSDAEFFLGMGILILEGFGLTETTPITNVNRPGEIKPGSVGRALIDTKIKISDEGEILIKGPQVMMGYYKDKKATAAAFTKDKFFRTGDVGVIDEMGRLSITGRIKDIIVTAGGKNISPQNIENSLKGSRYIEQVSIIGDRRKFLSALVIPAYEELYRWAKKNNIEYINNPELIENDLVKQLFEKEIEKYTGQFARVEQIRKFKLLNTEWSQATGELTPTLKVKRRVIEKKYTKEIKSIYDE